MTVAVIVTGAGQVQLEEAPTGELPRVELGASGAWVEPAGGAGTDVWPTGELPNELDTGTAGELGPTTGELGLTAGTLGTTTGVVAGVLTGAGVLVGTTGITLVVT